MAFAKGHTPHNKRQISDEQLKHMYLVDGMKVTEIARAFGIAVNPIYVRLRKLGINKSNSESHIGLQSKENNPNWKGGRHFSKAGYVITTDGKGKLIREHRVVAEKMIGRKLYAGEVVHHKNRKKYDNSPENLQVLASHSEHMKIHALLAVIEGKDEES